MHKGASLRDRAGAAARLSPSVSSKAVHPLREDEAIERSRASLISYYLALGLDQQAADIALFTPDQIIALGERVAK